MINRITPENIEKLSSNQIFVFGSNELGKHGKGAAKFALELCGAKYGIGYGLQGQSFAIPTKSTPYKTLSISKIKNYVKDFIAFAATHPELTFLVSKIGCGLAGFDVKEIAPLFKSAISIRNIHLPAEFWDELLIYQNSDPLTESDIEWANQVIEKRLCK